MVQTATDPDGNTTTYYYNSEGLLTEVLNPDQTTQQYSYDTADDLLSYTDENGNTTAYSYDTLGRLVNETDPANNNGQSPQTNWTYDAMRNVTQQSVLQSDNNSGQAWQTTNYAYNSVEELSVVSAPGPDFSGTLAVTKYSYTPTGQVYQVTDADSGVTTCGYDAIGEQTSVSLPDPATGAAGGPTSYTAYDPLGRTISTTDANDNKTTYTYQFGYVQNNHTYPGMTVTTTRPDATTGNNRSSDHGLVTTDEYDADGNLVSETRLRPITPPRPQPRIPTSVRVNWVSWILFGSFPGGGAKARAGLTLHTTQWLLDGAVARWLPPRDQAGFPTNRSGNSGTRCARGLRRTTGFPSRSGEWSGQGPAHLAATPLDGDKAQQFQYRVHADLAAQRAKVNCCHERSPATEKRNP